MYREKYRARKSFIRSDPPSFEIDNLDINKPKSLIIIKVPEAKEERSFIYRYRI
ncbi:hypothetical protein KYB31_12380 [Clostridium felsineum]|uniref:hypothetical protein n=1 Tax=Clostridium felsineum TaxID=36839 RepID=UPI00214DD654|nr:hypothetical protein [Clostridium felsineum]MCR3759770.1 hypothetical protein [Clostridium felsineum]